MSITGRVALGLEKRVEVPERAFDIPLSWHLVEAHLQQNLAELRAHFKQRVEVAALGDLADSVEVVLLELGVFPAACAQHISSELGFQLLPFGHVVPSLCNAVRLLRLQG